ncbi:uncharacterized protein DS421_19g642240 [Arachis hypogaea]|uniref:Uncharacterized protein n=1 Tax=Arachis hypogaea TaxID=3818 RepID=A0A6B9V4J9_ARAHY|nr:uncharacterized protein DS421_19g642240 [Arachis hypogaea]
MKKRREGRVENEEEKEEKRKKKTPPARKGVVADVLLRGVGSVPIVVVGVAAAEGGDDATPMGKKFKHGNLRVKQNLEKARSRSRRRQRMGHHSPWWISIYS